MFRHLVPYLMNIHIGCGMDMEGRKETGITKKESKARSSECRGGLTSFRECAHACKRGCNETLKYVDDEGGVKLRKAHCRRVPSDAGALRPPVNPSTLFLLLCPLDS